MYTVIENFKAGLVRQTTVLNMPPGSLHTAVNVHVTQSGEVVKHEDILLLERYGASGAENLWFGLVPTATKLYVFGSENY